jgi:hypothetical protein
VTEPELDFGLAGKFTFLSIFDWTLRKGWDLLVEAYLAEFTKGEPVTLLLKPTSTLGVTLDQAAAELQTHIRALGHDPERIPDIVFEWAELPDELMGSLYRAADCFVLPSRAEGEGRALLEAEAFGLPIIATGRHGVGHTAESGREWVEPKVGDLRRLMRAAVPALERPRVHVVMPLGVGAPGTPVLDHLQTSLGCLADQTLPGVKVTVSADENIPAEARELIESHGFEIAWYPQDTYYRPGGIWKKITDQWQKVDSDYVAFLHYDDCWEVDKLAEQVGFIEHGGLNGCYTRGYRMDNDGSVISGDLALHAVDRSQAGMHPGAWVVHALLMRRDTILESGILDHQDRWSAIFEQLYFLYALKVGGVAKCNTTAFYWRDHPHNMTNTSADETVEHVVAQRERTSYTLADAEADAGEINFDALVEQVRAGAL